MAQSDVSQNSDLALVLTGGGARAAYQVGVLRGIAERFPDLRFDIVTGVSAGAINAAFLASKDGNLKNIVDELCDLWSSLRIEDVMCVDPWSLVKHLAKWTFRLGGGGASFTTNVRGLVDTKPLHDLLERTFSTTPEGTITGISDNVSRCNPRAVALTTLDYATGKTVTWVSGCSISTWD